jgi:hypothetical protein
VQQEDLSYILKRARQERRCAIDAESIQARLAHSRMASAYEQQLRVAGVIVADRDGGFDAPGEQLDMVV